MATVGGNIETKQIGLPIENKGTYFNTSFDEATGTIGLKKTYVDANNLPVYKEEGYWISEIIDLKDKFDSYEKVFTTHTDYGASSIAIYTRTSTDNTAWSEWKAIAYDGSILSPINRYVQVKIEFYAGFITDVYLAPKADFMGENMFVEDNSGLRLKRNYNFDMTMDDTWTDEGSIHKKKITRDEWVRIDSLNLMK